MNNIQHSINDDIVKKILGNRQNALNFLEQSGYILPNKLTNLSAKEAYGQVVKNWNLDQATTIIRELFMKTQKYQSGRQALEAMNLLIKEWHKIHLGKIGWPCSQGRFDDFVQRLNKESTSSWQKDEKVKKAAVQYRRIKEINTLRNDFIETLVFEQNTNILPTLSHRRGVDFFVDGEQYDQKVSMSPTSQFQRDYRTNWRLKAIEEPIKVAQYLYTYQDEGRFGANPRLLIVYLDEDVAAEKIQKIIQETDLVQPLTISFQYNHQRSGFRTYQTKCFIILLYND